MSSMSMSMYSPYLARAAGGLAFCYLMEGTPVGLSSATAMCAVTGAVGGKVLDYAAANYSGGMVPSSATQSGTMGLGLAALYGFGASYLVEFLMRSA